MPITNLNFDFWSDEENENRRHAEEFLDSLGDVRAEQVAQILEEQYARLSLVDLLRDRKIRDVPGRPGLYYIRVNLKRIRVRLFGCIRGGTMWIVHGAVKVPLRDLSQEHFDTAEQRISKVA